MVTCDYQITSKNASNNDQIMLYQYMYIYISRFLDTELQYKG